MQIVGLRLLLPQPPPLFYFCRCREGCGVWRLALYRRTLLSLSGFFGVDFLERLKPGDVLGENMLDKSHVRYYFVGVRALLSQTRWPQC